MTSLKSVLDRIKNRNLFQNYSEGDIIKLSKNIFFSGSSQLITLISPLLITPYLIRILGIDLFGVTVMAQGIMMYFSYLVDYSFNIDATQEASIKRDNVYELTKLYNDVTWTRVFLLLTSAILLFCFSFTIPLFIKYRSLFFISFTITIGKTMIPQWLLVGTEHMKEMAFVNTISKVIVYISIFLIIHSAKDFLYVNFIWGLGDIIIAPFIYLFIKSKLQIRTLPISSVNIIKHKLLNGWPLFISNSMNGLYIYSNITILSAFSTPYLIGSYAVAEKVMLLIKQIAGIIFQATYPYACKLSEVSSDSLKRFLRNEIYIFAALFTLIGLFVLFLADYIVYFFVGNYDHNAILLLKLLAFVPLIVSLNMSASQMMLISGIRKQYAKIVTSVGILNVTANFALAPFFGPFGTVAAIILTETVSTFTLHLTLFKYYPNLRIFNLNRLVPNR
ncbi:oligosaccharide flippase family protein [Spirosoma panaciterrae]|uniref:oligosaccharide flippase family protein n=1 Tax=Spirosoma panaciterrae TaxID=496058 RepID=UPI00036CC721|nr:oligosaccharide flippase family protein [Spirosoma panaciterrae]